MEDAKYEKKWKISIMEWNAVFHIFIPFYSELRSVTDEKLLLCKQKIWYQLHKLAGCRPYILFCQKLQKVNAMKQSHILCGIAILIIFFKIPVPFISKVLLYSQLQQFFADKCLQLNMISMLNLLAVATRWFKNELYNIRK